MSLSFRGPDKTPVLAYPSKSSQGSCQKPLRQFFLPLSGYFPEV